MNWEIKCSWVHLTMGSVGPQGGKAPEKIAIFSLKLVYDSLLQITKLTVSNEKLLQTFFFMRIW